MSQSRLPLQSAATKVVAVGFAIAAGIAASAYPLTAWLLAPLLLAYAALLAWRPALWLLLVPALLPVIDLAPWTGWFFLEEVDLLLLVTAAVGYWRLGTAPRHARLPGFTAMAMLLLTLAYTVGTARGLGMPVVPDLNAFTSYLSHFNSLRVAKGFFWALILLPLLLRSVGPGLVNVRSLFVPGMLIGFAAVCIAAIWERAVFPGLLNFSADYRITAPFSAMHTGGAALDGYLALAMPCVAAWLFGERSRVRIGIAMLLLVLGAYVGLATFSRGVYLAFACTTVLFAVFALLRARGSGKLGAGRIVTLLILLALAGRVLDGVFASSGYRGLVAGIAVLGAVFLVGGMTAGRRGGRSPGMPSAMPPAMPAFSTSARTSGSTPASILLPLLTAAVLSGLSLVLSLDAVAATPLAVFRGVYGCFAASVGLFAVGIWLVFFGTANRRRTGLLLSRAACLWMMVNAALVAAHWGGNAALPAMAFLLLFAAVLAGANRVPALRLWQVDGGTVRFVFFCSVVLATAIPFSSSAYMSGRFSTVHGDLDGRLDHWSEALAMMTPDLATSAFGMGLGRYPETYFWKNQAHEIPSTFDYVRDAAGKSGNTVAGPIANTAANTYLRLGGPTYPRGYGEVIRTLQRVGVTPQTAYLFSVDVRHRATQPALDVALCERQLLYPQGCIGLPVRLAGTADGQWHHYEARVMSGSLGAGAWPMRAPVQLQMSTYGEQTKLDVDNVSLIDLQTGAELIRNGSFGDVNDHWFFSSDRHHLPFHVKNFALNIYFELGWFGVAGVCLLLGHALVRLLAASLQDDIMAQIAFAAMTGFLLVGLFDSLLDVPRLTTLFFTMLLLSVLRPLTPANPAAPARRRRHRQPAVQQAAMPVPAPASAIGANGLA